MTAASFKTGITIATSSADLFTFSKERPPSCAFIGWPTGLFAPVGFEQREEHFVAPDLTHTEIVAQQSFPSEPKFFDQFQ